MVAIGQQSTMGDAADAQGAATQFPNTNHFDDLEANSPRFPTYIAGVAAPLFQSEEGVSPVVTEADHDSEFLDHSASLPILPGPSPFAVGSGCLPVVPSIPIMETPPLRRKKG